MKLLELRNAAENGFESLVMQSKEVQILIDAAYASVPIMSNLDTHLQTLPRHKLSQELLPQSYKLNLIPLVTIGDGNCLYRLVNVTLWIY